MANCYYYKINECIDLVGETAARGDLEMCCLLVKFGAPVKSSQYPVWRTFDGWSLVYRRNLVQGETLTNIKRADRKVSKLWTNYQQP